MCHVQYRIALSKQCSAANRDSGLEKNGLEFLQNDKVEVFSKKNFCLFLKRKYLTFRRLENASLIFFSDETLQLV